MATATASKTTGITCPCPLCGATEGLVIRLHDATLECTECSETVDRREVVRMIDQAQRLLKLLDLAGGV